MPSKGVKHRKSKKKRLLYQAQNISNEKNVPIQDILTQLKALSNKTESKPTRKGRQRKIQKEGSI